MRQTEKLLALWLVNPGFLRRAPPFNGRLHVGFPSRRHQYVFLSRDRRTKKLLGDPQKVSNNTAQAARLRASTGSYLNSRQGEENPSILFVSEPNGEELGLKAWPGFKSEVILGA